MAKEGVQHATGKNLPKKQAGLCHAHLRKQILTNNDSGVKMQQVAKWARSMSLDFKCDMSTMYPSPKNAYYIV